MEILRTIGARVAARQEIVVVAIVVLTLALMVMPMPPVLADVLIALNIALSVLLMMTAIQVGGPVEFASLPSLILLTTTFRLALSITTSRMVLVDGDAGEIINAFGEFVIAGNVVVGLVVYLIITIVQFLVIAKGSERVAEVAARFMLDSLPGRQISIDTDLKNGDIDKDEARRRRGLLATESQLFGAMDGAMKFVKGDAIASLIIIVVNLIGGIVIGVVQRGLPFNDAVRTYSLLAVGDGLIAQIPALLISLTAGLTVTRATSEAGRNLGHDIVGQIIAQPRVLQVAAAILAALGFVPGFPTVVFLTFAIIVGAAGWTLARRAAGEVQRRNMEIARGLEDAPEPARLTVALAEPLLVDSDQLRGQLDEVRRSVSDRLGLPIPRLRVAPEMTGDAGWRLDVDGVPLEQGEAASVVEAVAGVTGALGRAAGRFIGVQETQRLIQGMEKDYADLVREATKAAPISRIAMVLRVLLEEDVSIRNLRAILEMCQSRAAGETDNIMLAELVRFALRGQICFQVAGPTKVLPVLLIDPALERALQERMLETHATYRLALGEQEIGRLISVLDHYAGQIDRPGASIALLSASDIRRQLALALKNAGRATPVLGHDEIAPDFRIEVVGTVLHNWLFPDQRPPQARPQLVA